MPVTMRCARSAASTFCAARAVQRRGRGDRDQLLAGGSPGGPRAAVRSDRAPRSAIQKSLDKLPTIYRLMLVLVDIEGMSYEEAASAAGIPVGTVKSRGACPPADAKITAAGWRAAAFFYQVDLPLPCRVFDNSTKPSNT